MVKLRAVDSCRRAFTLIELSFVLIIVGIIAGFALKMSDNVGRTECYVTTKAQLEKVREAIERFAMSNDRFPLPARRNVGVDAPNYGKEVEVPAIGDLDQVSNPSDGTIAVFGAVPTSTLGIAMDNATDCWGNKLTYVVTKSLTEARDPTTGKNPFLTRGTLGAITIQVKSGLPLPDKMGYAIISHGEDMLGAVKANYDSADRKWCGVPLPDGSIKEFNCLATSSTLMSAKFNNGKDAGAMDYFDDVIIYRKRPWRDVPPEDCRCTGPGPEDVFSVEAADLSVFTTQATCN